MDAVAWLGLERTDDPMLWRLPVTPGISTMGNFLFGGCGLGAAIGAMEGATGRPIVWATAQYLSYARPPSVLDIEVTIPQSGRQTTQARAVARVGDTEVLTVNAALGSRPLDVSGQWAERPDVALPEDCPARLHRVEQENSIMTRLDQRLAGGREMADLDGVPTDDGRCALWVRMPELLEMSGAALAILGDYVPFGIGQALGLRAGGNSLDNTLRVARPVPTEWVLLDIRIHAVANGYGHGLVHLWAEDHTLLATASQSTIVRFWEAPK